MVQQLIRHSTDFSSRTASFEFPNETVRMIITLPCFPITRRWWVPTSTHRRSGHSLARKAGTPPTLSPEGPL